MTLDKSKLIIEKSVSARETKLTLERQNHFLLYGLVLLLSSELSRPIPLNIETENARVGQAFMTHTCPTKSKTLKYVCPTSCKTIKHAFHTSRSIKLSCPSPLNIETENARVGQHASLSLRSQKSEVRSRDRGMGRWGPIILFL